MIRNKKILVCAVFVLHCSNRVACSAEPSSKDFYIDTAPLSFGDTFLLDPASDVELPLLDIETDNVLPEDMAFNDYEIFSMQLDEAPKISYCRKKFRELGIRILLGYIETKEFMHKTCLKAKSIVRRLWSLF